MADAVLRLKGARIQELAHRLAARENATVADIVERALEAYERAQATREPAAEFYARLTSDCAEDIDLEEFIQADRNAHRGVDL